MTIRSEKEADRAKAQAENRDQEVQDLTAEIRDIVTEITTLKEKLEQKNQLCSRRISFSDTLCFMRLQATQMSWSGESRERQIQILAQSQDWRFGVK